jgi:hypothetical protein
MVPSKVLVSLVFIIVAAGLGWFNYEMLISWDAYGGDRKDIPQWRKNIYKCIGAIVTMAFLAWVMHDFDKAYREIMSAFVTGHP